MKCSSLDLDLEADLGVDTVKQAELFAAVREIYNIPRDQNLKLRDFPTLAHIIRFVRERRPDLAAAPIVEATAQAVQSVASPAAPSPTDPVRQKVLEIVSEKTGYPVDMLDLDLDLEADLGVDTVKQADVFASVREAYQIPRDANLKLREFPTLAHVIQFIRDRRPDLVATVPAAPTQPAVTVLAETPAPDGADPVRQKVLEIVSEKTGYPVDMLDLDLDLEADLGVDTVKQADVFASVREAYQIPRDANLKLREFPTLAHVIQFIRDRRPDLVATVPAAPTQPAVSVPSETPAPDGDDPIRRKVLEIVSEKTGYPADMLDLDLDLEADLGVDTVKQADVFASVREAYQIPRDANLKLREFPTLAHVIQFIRDRRPDLVTTVPAAPTAPAVTAPPETAADTGTDPIRDRVLEIVAEKTGYPKEMLDLELDLEADLGIDTVKQADMFASVRAAFNIPRDANLKLREFPTLAHVIRFARGGQASPVAEPLAANPLIAAAPPVLASLEAANTIPRRIPVPVVRPPLSICKWTGVALTPGTRVIVMPDRGGVVDALTAELHELGVEALVLQQGTPVADVSAAIDGWLSAGPIAGVYWLPALDDEGAISAMDLAGWRECLRVRVKSLYTAMRTLYAQNEPAPAFLVTATRLGGQHGYDPAGATAPCGGSVSGFAKTYKRERQQTLVKAVDYETGADPIDIASLLVAETLRDNGVVEVGYKAGQRWSIGLREQPAAAADTGLSLGKDTVFVVTGAAGSIVSAITADLAAASGGTFYLLDMAPVPDPANADLLRFVQDKDGLKRDLFARLQARGERATPALVEKELAVLERLHSAQSAIDAVRAAGGTARYFSVNLTDSAAVADVVQQIRETSGRIDVLLHAAGLERSHFLPDKEPGEFDLVFDVKADGWFNLMSAIGDMPLGATVAFSSVAGRFGNAGQADYSAANDLLCKFSSSFRTTRPDTRAIAIDWTAWAGIGMAARGSIPKMMEMAGIEMLPPDAAIPVIRRELISGTRGEVVIAKALGILVNEWDESGGLDTAAVEESLAPSRGPLIGAIRGAGLYSGLIVETTLDPDVQGFLYDHQIEGTPVLPGVMGIEAFGEAALCMVPGWRVAAVEDVDFLAPFKFYHHAPRTITVRAIVYAEGDSLVADCRLNGCRQLPNHTEPQVTTHFTGRVRLTRDLAEAVQTTPAPVATSAAIDAAGIYQVYFHGPAYRVLERSWMENHHVIGQMAANLPEHHQPSERKTVLAPRVLELCFQTAGIWEIGTLNRMGLPNRVGSISFGANPINEAAGLFAIITPHSDTGTFDAEIVDGSGMRHVLMAGYQTVPIDGEIKAEPLKALHALVI